MYGLHQHATPCVSCPLSVQQLIGVFREGGKERREAETRRKRNAQELGYSGRRTIFDVKTQEHDTQRRVLVLDGNFGVGRIGATRSVANAIYTVTGPSPWACPQSGTTQRAHIHKSWIV